MSWFRVPGSGCQVLGSRFRRPGPWVPKFPGLRAPSAERPAPSPEHRTPSPERREAMQIKTIDAHTGGEPLRLIVDGFPTIEGKTMLEKRAWLAEHHDQLRTALMLEPRGHADMYGAILTEPEHASSDAGVLFMHNQGYSTMC